MRFVFVVQKILISIRLVYGKERSVPDLDPAFHNLTKKILKKPLMLVLLLSAKKP